MSALWCLTQIAVVANHVGPQNGALDEFSQFVPFSAPEHYHRYCEIHDWNNQTEVEYCRLGTEEEFCALSQ